MMKRKTVLLALLAVLVIVGCATLGGVKSDWGSKTPQEKSLIFMETYNAQYADVLSIIEVNGGYDNLGPSMKKVVDAKAEILTKAYPMIKAYNLILEGGGTPDKQTEALILDLLNQLVSITVGGDA